MKIDPKLAQFYGRVSGAVMFKVALILGGFFGGSALDKRFHTGPFLMMLGLVLGAGLGIWYLMRVIDSASR